MSLSVLVVEDEPKVQKFVRKALEQAGMRVESTGHLDEIDEHLRRIPCDVLILDRLVENRDSLSLVGKLRKAFPRTRILILSALGELNDRVAGLNVGADDYLPKPFHVAELIARVRSVARRDTEEPVEPNLLRFSDLTVRLDSQEVTRGDRSIPLTAKEFRLLSLLVQKPRKLFTRMELLDRVWGLNADPGSNVVEVTINRLRAKLDTGAEMPLIHTKRGAGYWLGESPSHD